MSEIDRSTNLTANGSESHQNSSLAMSASIKTDLNTTYLELMPADNLTYANDSSVINALQEEKLLSESVFDLEASLAFGAVAGLFAVIICTIGACWYVLARRKQYADPKAM